jgi:hypothetical protein
MDKAGTYKVVATEPKTPLQKFALWFHQDWYVQYPNFHEGARMYIEQLSSKEKMALASELEAFTKQHQSNTGKGAKNAWLKLGAAHWQKELEILPTLKEWAAMARGK